MGASQARDDAGDDACRRIIEATRACAPPPPPPPPPRPPRACVGEDGGDDERKAASGMTRARVIHARVSDARDDAGDGVRRRVIEATRARRAAAAAPRTRGGRQGETRRKRGFGITFVRVTRARVIGYRNDAR